MQNVFTKFKNLFGVKNINNESIIEVKDCKIIRRAQTVEEKKLKKKIIIISTIIGCISFICVFTFIIFNEDVDIKPYTDSQIHELYIQRSLVTTKNYKYEEMNDFKYSVDFKSDYYENTYENNQVILVEKVDYKGKVLSQDIYDKAKNKVMVYIANGIISFIFSLFIAGLICIVSFKRYNID